jgi:DNA polymerase type B, organellar and viral
MNLIAKLLMNSLYGKFGMGLDRSIFEIYDIKNKAEEAAFLKLLEGLAEPGRSQGGARAEPRGAGARKRGRNNRFLPI